MAISFDGPTKIITLGSGTTVLSVRELWSRWVDWFVESDNSKYAVALTNVGGEAIDTSEGTYIPIYAFLQNGWRIRPQESNHTLRVNDGILLVSGGGDPFINTIGNYIVRINFSQPVQAITVSTSGGGGGGATPSDIAQAVRAELTTELSRIDVPVSSRLAFADYTPPLPSFTIGELLNSPLASYNTNGTLGKTIKDTLLNAKMSFYTSA